MPGLKIEIDANVAKVAKSIGELNSDLKKFKDELTKATDVSAITKLNNSIKSTEATIKAIKGAKGFDDFNQQIKAVKPGADQAANALTNMGRVASDAPFGFIAIQNNLDPLIQSFGYLVRETGSTKAAFGALLSSLSGAAGIGLAFSVLSSLLTTIIQKYGSLGNAINALTSDSGAAVQAQRDLNLTFADAEGKAAGEIAQITALLSVARDHTLSKKAQQEAIDKLNQEYDKYLPKLTAENINTEKVNDAVNKLTESIVRQAKIKGLQDLISKESAKQAELFAKSLGENANTLDNIVALFKSMRTGGNFFTEQQLAGAARTGKEFTEAKNRIEIFNKALLDLTRTEAEAGTLTVGGKQVDLLKQRIAALKELQSLTGLTSKQSIELAQLEIQLAKRDAVKVGFSKEELNQQIEGILDKSFGSRTEFGEALHILKIKAGLQPSLVRQPIKLSEGFSTDIAKAVLPLGNEIPPVKAPVTIVPEFNFAADAITKGFQDALVGLSEDLGNAMSTGDFASGLKAAAETVLHIIGGVLQEIGKQLIITSSLVKAVKAALKGLFGPGGDAAALAVGIGLVAFGAVLKNIKFDSPKLAEGGVVTSPTFLSGEAGTEAVIPLNRLPYLMGSSGNAQPQIAVGLRIKDRELIAFIEKGKKFSERMGG